MGMEEEVKIGEAVEDGEVECPFIPFSYSHSQCLFLFPSFQFIHTLSGFSADNKIKSIMKFLNNKFFAAVSIFSFIWFGNVEASFK